MLERKCQAVSQITFDEDMNVPDVKPDMGRMIQKKGNIQIEDIQITEGKAYITGALQHMHFLCYQLHTTTPFLFKDYRLFPVFHLHHQARIGRLVCQLLLILRSHKYSLYMNGILP